MARTIPPFHDGDTTTSFRTMIQGVVAEIKALDNEYVVKASPAELEQYYTDRVQIRPLVLYVDNLYVDDREGIDIDVTGDFRRRAYPGKPTLVRGTRLTVVIPFEGDPTLWRLRASTFSLSGYPEIAIRDGAIAFDIEFLDDAANAEKIRERIDDGTQSLAEGVGYIKTDVDSHNASAPEQVRQALHRKRASAESTLGVLSNLGLPIRHKDQPPAFALPVKRRPMPVRPAVAAGKYEPEPFLDEAEYEYILNVLRSMSLVMERTPSAFSTLEEEHLRTHFLLHLNGHYEGGATGETFNAAGKTDILIRSGDRNVFIAECKFWHGSKGFNDTIDQLLGYLTWRDTKAAILVFNKTKGSSSVRDKMHEVMQERPECKKTVFSNTDGDSRYILVKPSEPGKEVIVTTQLYDVPAKK
jgi:hypothetical protein